MSELNHENLGIFADPLPGEILYSSCARLFDRTRASNSKALIGELFRSTKAASVIDLPCHLNHFISVLPIGHRYTVDYLLSNHTLLPFYTTFLPPLRVEQLKQDMASNDGLKARMRCGGTSSSIQAPSWLRFCPVCVKEDKEQYGSPYWHRLHQATGVEVCPFHNVFLENSSVRARGRRIRHELVSAKKAIQSTNVRPLNPLDATHQQLVRIAQDVLWLLSHPDFVPGLETVRARYIKLLVERGFATYTKQVRVQPLIRNINGYYSAELLKLLQCEVREEDHNAWVLRLTRSPKHAYHPLYHLLLIQFLGYTIEEFFQLSGELKPFGDGPWPCLNPVCPHFRQLCIQTFELKHDKTHGGRMTATFCCECGSVYSRLGPDTSPEDVFKVGKIKARGEVWETALKELWLNPAVTLEKMADRLGVDSQSVKYHAARLNLTFPRLGPTAKQTQETVFPSPKAEDIEPAKLKEYRNEWLEIVQTNPNAGRSELSKQYSRVFGWLSFYDREWLYDHLPPPKRKPSANAQVDWHSRDTEIATAARNAAEQIRNKLGKPERVTKTAIGSNSGYLTFIQKQLVKLPLTAAALAELVETTEDFAVRRVHWVAECFRLKGVYPKKWQIVRQAGLKLNIAKMPKVEKAIDSVLEAVM